MGMRRPSSQSSLTSPSITFVLVFCSGLYLGAVLPNERWRPKPFISKDSPKYGGQMLRASFITSSSEGQAIIPGAATDWVESSGASSGSNRNRNTNTHRNRGGGGDDDDVESESCDCSKKKSASELLSSFGESGLGQLASPSISKEDALAKIDALQRARTHLAKEKANLEGERNALNKVVKEAQRSADQCLKDLKKKKGGH